MKKPATKVTTFRHKSYFIYVHYPEQAETESRLVVVGTREKMNGMKLLVYIGFTVGDNENDLKLAASNIKCYTILNYTL